MKTNVLVIDDEESIRFTFRRFLKDAGYEVKTAAGFSEAMTRISEQDPDLVFADILLGGDTGIDVLREIKGRNLSCPLVLITGYPKIETAAEAVRLGAFDYLPKPVKKETLLQVTKLALLHKSMVDANESYRSNLEAVFSSVKDAIVLLDGELRVTVLNEAAKGFFDLSGGAVGQQMKFLLDERNAKCRDAIEEALNTNHFVELRHIECGFGNGPGRVASMTASPMAHPGGGFSGVVMVMKDETRVVDLERARQKRGRFHNIVGKSEKMQEIYSRTEDLASVQTTVLITGESGTGKELLAEAIHHMGERGKKHLVKVNCSALTETLLESELFGHAKGAFTGAVKDKIGRFQMAEGGTIFLDEIGDISSNIQQRLLRVLQEREFERVGDSRPIRANVRVIAATNKNLQEKVKSGEFREDLYYRLRVVEITLPPLRERKEDIPLLVAHFVDKLNTKLGKKIDAVSEDVLRILVSHPWPGNVRQLAHTIEHAFVFCHQNIVTVEHLPTDFKEKMPTASTLRDGGDRKVTERDAIIGALRKTAGNKALSARILGISRRTIHRKIIAHHIILDQTSMKCVT